MKRPQDIPPAAEVVSVPDTAKAPPMPSQDQRFFDESLRASVRSLGRLIRERRKPEQ